MSTSGNSGDTTATRGRYGRDVTPSVITAGITGVALLSGVILRWFDLGRLSLWWDEGFTAWASSLSPAFIVRFARNDNQAPVYYLLEHYWGTLFGNSEYALRALSALFGTLSLPVFYLFAKKVLKEPMAVVLAIWLFAFSTKQIWYSREARAYEVGSFLALVSLCALVCFLERRTVVLFLTIVLSAAGTLYMHNMMFFFLLALDVIWVVYPSERAWTQRVKEALLADVLVGILYLPWAVSLFTQVGAVGGNLWWVPRPTGWTLIRTLRDMAGFEPEYLSWVVARFLRLSPQTAEKCVIGGVVLVCAAMLVGGVLRVRAEDRRKDLSMLLYGLLPILLVFVLSQRALPLYIDRVFTPSSLVVPIVFAFPLALQKGPRMRIFYGLLATGLAASVALSAFGFVKYQEPKAKYNEDWRGATRRLVGIRERNRLIAFVPPAGEMLFDYYSRSVAALGPGVVRMGLPASYHDQFPPPKARIVDARETERLKLAVESKSYSEVDLVVAHNVDAHELLMDFLSRGFVRGEDKAVYGMRIVRFLEPTLIVEAQKLSSDILDFSNSRALLMQRKPSEPLEAYRHRITAEDSETRALYTKFYYSQVADLRGKFAQRGLTDRDLDECYERPTHPLAIREVGERLSSMVEALESD